MKGFCEKKFRSMLISGTFTKAVMYLMLLSDSIIAGFFIGESGVAGINGMWAGFAATPILTLIFAMLFVYLRYGKDIQLLRRLIKP